MKRTASAISIALLLGLLATFASAQFTTITSFQVQNLTNETVNGQAQFYDASGDEVIAATALFTITANSSLLFTQGNNEDLPSGFDGSVVVMADKAVAAIGVQETTNPQGQRYQGTYGAFYFDTASDVFYVPTVMKAFYGYTTEISVQNAGGSEVDVVISYKGNYTDSVDALQPGAVHRFDNSNTPSMPDGYIGYGRIEAAGGNVVAVVNQNNEDLLQQQTYEGFSEVGSAPTLYAPVLMKAFYGFDTSVQVQLVGAGPADVTIYYSHGYTETQTLTETGSVYLFTQGNEPSITDWRWIGSAYITSDAGNIVAVVNEQNNNTGKAASYNAFSGGSTRYVGPNVMKEFYGFETSVQVQNLDPTPASCTATFSNGTSQTTPSDLGQYEFYLFTQGNNDDLGDTFIGSVMIECGGNNFVALVNQDGVEGTGDNAMAYSAIAAP